MKRTVTENEFYQIRVDGQKNRLFITLKGTWRSLKEVSHYVEDVNKASQMLERPFTLLANFSMLLPFTPEMWEKVHQPALSKLLHNGLGKSSQILPRNAATTELLEKNAIRHNVRLTAFGDEAIAERYLD